MRPSASPASPALRFAASCSALCALIALSGCMHARSSRNATSVVDFLYPSSRPEERPQVPVLNLPIRVGVAFVPAGRPNHPARPALTEEQRLGLLETVADHFEQKQYVGGIEVIPGSYLRPQGSFANLDQLRSLFDVDVIALVSYDQVQFVDQGFLSLTYWTIVGAYVVPGEKNDTHTMLDTVVYDVASRKMLFRAPGTHHTKGRATPTNLSEQLREDREEGFQRATEEMIANLDPELEEFRVRVRERPEEYRVVERPGYSGGGSLDPATLALFAVLAGAVLRTRRFA
jgi:rhombotail lipoprotein